MKAEEIVKKLLEYGLAMDDPIVLGAVEMFAAEIAKLCEEELAEQKALHVRQHEASLTDKGWEWTKEATDE